MSNVTLYSSENPEARLVVSMSDWSAFIARLTDAEPMTSLVILMNMEGDDEDSLTGVFNSANLKYLAVQLWQNGFSYRQKGVLNPVVDEVPEAFLKAFGEAPDNDEDGLILIQGLTPENTHVFVALVFVEGTHKGERAAIQRYTFTAVTSQEDPDIVLRTVLKKPVFPEAPENFVSLFVPLENPEQYIESDRNPIMSDFLTDLTGGPLYTYEASYTMPCNPECGHDWYIRVIVNVREATRDEVQKEGLL